MTSINDIIGSIDGDSKSGNAYKKIIYVIENKEIMENFEMIRGFRENSYGIIKKRHGRGNN